MEHAGWSTWLVCSICALSLSIGVGLGSTLLASTCSPVVLPRCDCAATSASQPSAPSAPPAAAAGAVDAAGSLRDHLTELQQRQAAQRSTVFAQVTAYDYCRRVTSFRRQTNKSVAEDRVMFCDVEGGSLMHVVLSSMGYRDPHRHRIHRQLNQLPFMTASSATRFFWINKLQPLYQKMSVFPCRGQVAEFLPGCEYAGGKSLLVGRLRRYEASFVAEARQCFVFEDYMPLSYRLGDTAECERFVDLATRKWRYNQLHNVSLNHDVTWIHKVGEGVQNARGLSVLDDKAAHDLAVQFREESACAELTGSKSMNVLAQSYIENPLLVNGKKVDMRVYLVLASVKPLVAFFYPGFVRRSGAKYNSSSLSDEGHYSNIAASKKLKEFSIKSHLYGLHHLQRYLEHHGYTDDPHFMERTVKRKMKQTMAHILNAVEGDLEKWPGRFGIWGLDFMLDTNMKLWFLEVNTRPNLKTGARHPSTEGLKSEMLRELFELEEHYLERGVAGFADFQYRQLEPLLVREYSGKRKGRDGWLDVRVNTQTMKKYKLSLSHQTEWFGLFDKPNCQAAIDAATTRMLNRQQPLHPPRFPKQDFEHELEDMEPEAEDGTTMDSADDENAQDDNSNNPPTTNQD